MRIQYTLKVYPAGLGRSVYRTRTICGTDTLDQLCMAILNAFDFTAEHLYEFYMDNKMYREDCYRFNPVEDDLFDEDDAEGTDIALDELGLIEGQKFSLHYDFGDDWMFAIRVMKIEEVKRHRKPMLLSSKGSVEQYPEGEECLCDLHQRMCSECLIGSNTFPALRG